METSRNGYLAAISASSYSFISLLRHFAPIIKPGTFLILLSIIPSFFLFLFCLSVIFPCTPSPLSLKGPLIMNHQVLLESYNLSFQFEITGGATISLTYIASERTIPGYVSFFHCNHWWWALLRINFFICYITSHRYGGGMSSAKAALESDTRVSNLLLVYLFRTYHISPWKHSGVFFFFDWPFSISFHAIKHISSITFLCLLQVLAFEAGRKHSIRVNTISAGTAISFFMLIKSNICF